MLIRQRLRRAGQWLWSTLRAKMGGPVDDDVQPGLRRGDLDLEASRILRELAKDGVLYRLGWTGLLRHLLDEYHAGSIFAATPEALRAAAARALDYQPDELPLDEGLLAAKVVSDCLHIDKLPRDEFVAVQQEAAADLRTIRANIKSCEDEKAVIDARVERKEGDGHRLEFLKHKVQENEEARGQIIAFLETGVLDEVLHLIWRSYFGQFSMTFDMFHAPYRFRRLPHLYDPRHLSDARNKFRDRPVSEGRRWVALHRQNPSDFHQKLPQYIADLSVVQEVRDGLSKNHRLAARADVLGPALDAYESGQVAVFCNLVPIQIEGLIGDYCRDLGIGEDSLRSAVLTAKLDQLNAKLEVFSDFEYFRSRFPLLRNRVAHGRFDSTSAAQTADLLLLDLKDVSRRLQDEDLPVNKLVVLVRRIDLLAPEPGDLFRIALQQSVELPSFYGLDQQRADAETALSGAVLWDWIEQLVDANDQVLGAFLKPVVDALKRRDLDGRRGRALLQKIGAVTGAPTEDEFWMAVGRLGL